MKVVNSLVSLLLPNLNYSLPSFEFPKISWETEQVTNFATTICYLKAVSKLTIIL